MHGEEDPQRKMPPDARAGSARRRGRRTVRDVVEGLRSADEAAQAGRREDALRLMRRAQVTASRLGGAWLLETARARLARLAREAPPRAG